MKRQAWIKTGMLKPHKVTRQRVANAIRKCRTNGERLKRFISADGYTFYQSNSKYDPYLYITKGPNQ